MSTVRRSRHQTVVQLVPDAPRAPTVSDLIAALQRQNPKALVLWRGGSCTAHSIGLDMEACMVSDFQDGTLFSILGPAHERTIPAVMIDIIEPQ